jgi:sigma-E factor negative regulatory protein RseC
MIEEYGQVIRVEEGYAWVETRQPSACGTCAAGEGCGTSVLAGVLGRRKAAVRVADRIGVVAGDRVVIGVPESSLVRGSLAVYAVPLAGLFLGALTGQYLGSGWFAQYGELSSLLGGGAGFVCALAWLRHFSRATSRDDRYQPVLLRRQMAGRATDAPMGPMGSNLTI